jgi:hypothetical protein
MPPTHAALDAANHRLTQAGLDALGDDVTELRTSNAHELRALADAVRANTAAVEALRATQDRTVSAVLLRALDATLGVVIRAGERHPGVVLALLALSVTLIGCYSVASGTSPATVIHDLLAPLGERP